MALGDFNEIIAHHEKQRDKSFLIPKRYLKDLMENCDVVDLSVNGPRFTWINNQSQGNKIKKRLDREIASARWILNHPIAFIFNNQLQSLPWNNYS